MLKLKEMFQLKVTRNRLQAQLYLNHQDVDSQTITVEKVIQFLHEHQIIYGIKRDAITSMIQSLPNNEYPVIVAEGIKSEAGEDGIFEKVN